MSQWRPTVLHCVMTEGGKEGGSRQSCPCVLLSISHEYKRLLITLPDSSGKRMYLLNQQLHATYLRLLYHPWPPLFQDSIIPLAIRGPSPVTASPTVSLGLWKTATMELFNHAASPLPVHSLSFWQMDCPLGLLTEHSEQVHFLAFRSTSIPACPVL